MFETAEVGNSVDKKTYAREAPKVRSALLAAQHDLASTPLSVVIVVAGIEGAGKSETVNLLLEWMDARGIRTYAFGDPSDEEGERPPMWRFWRALPPKGRTDVFLVSWYTAPLARRTFRRIKDAKFEQELDHIVDFERMLAAEDTLVLKFWLHLSKGAQRKRLSSLERNPLTRWRVTDRDWKFFARYDRFRRFSEQALRHTNTAEAPWTIIEASDHRYRHLTVGRAIATAMEQKIAAIRARPKPAVVPDLPKPKKVNIIRQLDLSKKLSDAAYEKKLPKLQGSLYKLSRRLYEGKRSAILVFEGPDAAGKGGTIRRITNAMDARLYEVSAVAAPTDEELAHPYLWRFWRNLPRLGRVTIYDRSWYGRVLVERVEGFAQPKDWQRAYGEINAFEEELLRFGIVVLKFWLAISPEEQLRRFKNRENTPYKHYKITKEDWRNRHKWSAYEAAACDMIEKTSTEKAPWVLVEADDKNWSRVKVLKTVVNRLEEELS
jgi:polyphosphate:AMP phosphotransferase